MVKGKKACKGLDIVLDEKYHISSDKMNVILDEKLVPKKGPKAGQETWKPVSFHGTIDEALVKYFRIRTNCSDANTAAKLITEWNKTIRSLRKIMKEYKSSDKEK